MEKILNYIGGKLAEPSSGKFVDNYNPSEGKIYSLIADSDERDVSEAVKAAKQAFPLWSTMPAEERCKILLRIADLIDRDLEKLSLAESIDNGKTVKLAKAVDIYRASANMKFYATAAMHFASEAHVNDGDSGNYTTRMPIGVVGCISPWNLPLYLFTWKIAPALAAGCSVIGKPSELTPMTAFLFSKLCIEAGLPAGVLNIVHGLGDKVGQAIIDHREITAISFTGGTVTGKKIAATAAPMFKKLSLELGGKNPNIVFADCDFQQAIKTSLLSSFTNQEEIFGPVVTVMPSDTEEEALAFANSTSYGLAATIWTENLKKAHRVAHQTKSGIIWINCWLHRDLRTPFGGMKQSGVGREGGWEAIKFFIEAKNVCVQL